jgi:hypothetical protein
MINFSKDEKEISGRAINLKLGDLKDSILIDASIPSLIKYKFPLLK